MLPSYHLSHDTAELLTPRYLPPPGARGYPLRLQLRRYLPLTSRCGADAALGLANPNPNPDPDPNPNPNPLRC